MITDPALLERIAEAVVNGNHDDARAFFRNVPVRHRAGAALDLLAYLHPSAVRRLVESAQ